MAWAHIRQTALIIGLTTILAPSATLGGTVLYVDDDAPPEGDGASWPTAFRFLQDALAAARASGAAGAVDEIHVAQGLYRPDQDEAGNVTPGDQEATFALISGVAVMGGYAGLGAPDPDERDIELYETILTGDLAGDDEPGFINYDENSFHVVTGSDVDETATLDGFTVTAGNAAIGGYGEGGGGMRVYWSGSPTVVDCTFIANRAEGAGGALLTWVGHSAITRCTFRANTADVGGALYTFSTTTSECIFSGNTAEYGGAVACEEATLIDCTLTDNTADEGGAIYLGSGSTVTGCAFLANTAFSGGALTCAMASESAAVEDSVFRANTATDRGGAVLVPEYSQLTVEDCTFEENTADMGGAVCDESYDAITFIGNTLTGNTAQRGGGMCLMAPEFGAWPATVTSCTFTENSALFGGGLYAYDKHPKLTECTLQRNTAEDSGGGLYLEDWESSLVDCVFEANTAGAEGGGLYNIGLAALDGCAFRENTAEDGGGIYNIGSPVLTGCSFLGNIAADGAGFHHLGGAATLTGCTLRGNHAVRGGGLYAMVGQPVLTDCSLAANGADKGGAVYNAFAELAVTRCVLSENTATTGAGIYNSDGVLTVLDSEFTENSANGGAAMYLDRGAATIQHCDVTSNTAQHRAGGIYVGSDETTMTGCTFRSNTAGCDGGGGIYIGYCSPRVVDCLFTDNLSHTDGGALRMAGYGSPEIVDCAFSENLAEEDGGGIFTEESDPTFLRCAFTGNRAGESGGGLASHYQSDPILTDCVLIGNRAEYGGGLSDGAFLTAVSCLLEENVAAQRGGGLKSGANSLMVGCVFRANETQMHGGAVVVLGGYCSLINCGFFDNVSVYNGGAIENRDSGYYDADLFVINSTFCGNEAPDGGAIYHFSDGDAAIDNCIFWDNTYLPISCPGEEPIFVSYSDVEGGWDGPGEHNIDADPLFRDLASGDYRLLPGSPCIDAGDNTALPLDELDLDNDGDMDEPIPVDLNWNPRLVDDPDTEDTGNGEPPIVDMGACEYQLDTCPADFDDDGDVDTADLLFLLGAWGTPDGDVNGDGFTDTFDLLALLAAWGECP